MIAFLTLASSSIVCIGSALTHASVIGCISAVLLFSSTPLSRVCLIIPTTRWICTHIVVCRVYTWHVHLYACIHTLHWVHSILHSQSSLEQHLGTSFVWVTVSLVSNTTCHSFSFSVG
uniref:Uncharacterized protein n=1 Tax=Cacopsylla melanoneura TaxID=428564 RepID=A0A8D9BNV2_9HEMI